LNEWFGSVEGFETAAMAELASASKAQMGRQVFPWHPGTMQGLHRARLMYEYRNDYGCNMKLNM